MTSHSMEEEVAKAAWAQCKEGVTENFQAHRVVRHKDMVLVMPRVEKWSRGDKVALHVVAFPKPLDIDAFKKSSGSVAFGGPAHACPGGIGTITIYPYRNAVTAKPFLYFLCAQSHFKTGKQDGFLPRRLATKYNGWRKKALLEVMKIAQQYGMEIQFHPSSRHDRSSFHNEVLAASHEANSDVTYPEAPRSMHMVIKPRNKPSTTAL